MSTVFNDTFTGASGTALTAHTPNTGSSWSLGTSAAAPVIDNNNKLKSSGTGANNLSLANPVSALASHDYTVSCEITWLGTGGAGGGTFRLYSHGTVAAAGYVLSVIVAPDNSFQVTAGGNGIGGTSPNGVTMSVGDTLVLTVPTVTNGSACDVDFFLQRKSDNFYLKYDGTWQAGQVGVRAEGTIHDTSPLAFGKGGLDFFVYAGDSIEWHADNFLITGGSGPNDGGPLAFDATPAATPAVNSVGLAWSYTGGTSPTFQVHRSTTPGFTPTGSSGGSGTCLATTASTSYTDSAATAVRHVTYYYLIVGTDPSTAGATSDEAPCQPYRMALKMAIGPGDSQYMNNPPDAYFADFAREWDGYSYDTSTINIAWTGSRTTDWLPTASAWAGGGPSTGGANLLLYAEGLINAAGSTEAFLRLAFNDAGTTSATTYGAHLATITAHLLANCPTLLHIYIPYPTYGVG
jgi:hypothetical protein